MTTKPLRAVLTLVSVVLSALAAPAIPIPTDLQLVPSDVLPTHATWWSIQKWGRRAPIPVNWCRGRTDVLYYRSPSFGTNKILIDDTLVVYPDTQTATALTTSMETTETLEPLGPPFGPNDIWLDIKFHGNATNNLVDVILHGATNALSRGTNSVWQLLTKANLDDTNTWTVAEIQVDDGSTNAIYFGPFSDLNPPATYYRAQLATNLLVVVATNLPYPVAIDYHSPSNSLILSVAPPGGNLHSFYMLDKNGVLGYWSSLTNLQEGFHVKIGTAKATANGFTNGDLFFGGRRLSGLPKRTGLGFRKRDEFRPAVGDPL